MSLDALDLKFFLTILQIYIQSLRLKINFTNDWRC